MSRSDGFTMLEAMLSLAILALIATISIRAYTRGNPGLKYRAAVSEVIAEARAVRRNAQRTGTTAVFNTDVANCDLDLTEHLVFFADGSVRQAELCLIIADRPTVLRTVGLTGEIEVVE